MRYITLILTLLALTGCVVPVITPDWEALTPSPTLALPTVESTPDPTATPGRAPPTETVDGEREFARGFYAACVTSLISTESPYPLTAIIAMCRDFTIEILNNGMYELEVPGFQWPLDLTEGISG